MSELVWTRSKSANGYTEHLATGPDGTTYKISKEDGGWDVIVEAPGERLEVPAYGLPTLADAKLAALALLAGGSPGCHRISAAGRSRPSAVRGIRMTIAKWSCSCGERQHGSSPGVAAARKDGYWQHWRPTVQAMIDGAAS